MARYRYLNAIHPIIERHLQALITPNSRVIDATLGNGFDTEKIIEQLGPKGAIYAFDIQKEAVERSRDRLQPIFNQPQENRPEITLICDSHTQFARYITEPIDFIIYNLGYLPKGDKTITTQAHTTLESIKVGLQLLAPNGTMLIALYPGHPAGKVEKYHLEKYLSKLDQRQFHVLQEQFINQQNHPPLIYLIEKAKVS